jgi:hypothetical protein
MINADIQPFMGITISLSAEAFFATVSEWQLWSLLDRRCALRLLESLYTNAVESLRYDSDVGDAAISTVAVITKVSLREELNRTDPARANEEAISKLIATKLKKKATKVPGCRIDITQPETTDPSSSKVPVEYDRYLLYVAAAQTLAFIEEMHSTRELIENKNRSPSSSSSSSGAALEGLRLSPESPAVANGRRDNNTTLHFFQLSQRTCSSGTSLDEPTSTRPTPTTAVDLSSYVPESMLSKDGSTEAKGTTAARDVNGRDARLAQQGDGVTLETPASNVNLAVGLYVTVTRSCDYRREGASWWAHACIGKIVDFRKAPMHVAIEVEGPLPAVIREELKMQRKTTWRLDCIGNIIGYQRIMKAISSRLNGCPLLPVLSHPEGFLYDVCEAVGRCRLSSALSTAGLAPSVSMSIATKQGINNYYPSKSNTIFVYRKFFIGPITTNIFTATFSLVQGSFPHRR